MLKASGGRRHDLTVEYARTRPAAARGHSQRDKELIEFFERMVWPRIPAEVLGKPAPRREQEAILGYERGA